MPQLLVASVNPITVVATGLALCALAATLLSRKVRPAVEAAFRAVVARLRPHLPAPLRRVARRYRDRVEPATARSVVITGIAAGIAWSAAETLHLSGSIIAAISATLSVQLSSHASMREGAQRLVGTLAGLALTVVAWGAFGLNPLSIAMIAGCGLAAGRLLRLGDAAVTVPATSLGIIVAGSAVTEAFVWERIAATALGIVVGAILSPLVGGMTPLERARVRLADLSGEIARLLGHLGAGVCGGYTRDQAAEWLARSRELGENLEDAVTAVDDLTRQARWSLTTPLTRVTPMHQTLRALEHGVHQVNSVARSMFDATATPQAAGVPRQIGQVLSKAAEAFAAHATLVADHHADSTRDASNLHELLDGLREARQRTLRKVRTEVDDTGVLVLTGSIITDIDRMAGSLERSAPALTVGVREPGPGIPAVSEILPAVRLIWEKKVTARTGR
ncbi:aromatic acid exporter family protein [Actinoplanes sp. NEAU-A12]|uniref:Aromatic acid exporter family protein n=1 Tax=Actinoplanes sandaracinus TaxID=3045177 RepID=A0ABT6WHZ3_9ACTN|nr:aromatic acid exporter family protein [Actinoplanes sandaracinus]MDI6099357.1 aromatic acid exporter family protein [Actinoplanes sandaracinus]